MINLSLSLKSTHRYVDGVNSEVGDQELDDDLLVPRGAVWLQVRLRLWQERLLRVHGPSGLIGIAQELRLDPCLLQRRVVLWVDEQVLAEIGWVVDAAVGRVLQGLELEEARHVVQRREQQDRQDVESGLDVVAKSEKWGAYRDVPKIN